VRARAAVERYLHEHIPLSAHIGTRVVEADGRTVRLGAPLAPNLNHRQTAFGGSLSALAILAGWTWVWVRLSALGFDGRIVIQSNTIDYTAPAEGDLEAVCAGAPDEEWDDFVRALRRRGRARIGLAVEVMSEGTRAARFGGRYVAVGRIRGAG
jgi:thioesterase domain-containing protein